MPSALSSSLGLLALTLMAFGAGTFLHNRSGKKALLQPVLIATLVVVLVLLACGLPYERYAEGTRPLHSLLGPAIVALAVPLHDNLLKARAVLWPMLAAILLGAMAVTGSALWLGWALRLEAPMIGALATKSVTAPIALSIAAKIGGSAPLTVLGVFVTGLLGAILTPALLRRLRTDDPRVQGLVLGMTSHAFGIARAVELGSEAVAFATLGMGLMGCLSALVIPLLWRWV